MASSLGCLTDSLPQLNTSFLQFQVRAIVVVLELPDKTNSVQTHPPKIATAEKSKHVASANPNKPAGNVKSVMENSALLIFKNPKKFVEEGNDYPGDDSLGIGAVETSPSPVVDRNVSVNTKDCTADGGCR
uniref:Uncharacterized protein n=1 Tax=Brassica campestris TaxID=3711 RepID=M4EI55_BRACM